MIEYNSFMINILKIILFLLSNFGYFYYLKKKTGIDNYYIPLVAIAFQMITLFFGGLLNILKEVSIIMYCTGIFFFIKFFIYNKKENIINTIKNNINIVFFLTILVIIVIKLKGALLYDYDNFSHWGLVVKHMLSVNRFPNFTDKIITFQQYPLGMASYIYYFSKMTSPIESNWMVAQSYVILCSLLPLIKYIKTQKVLSYCFLIFFIDFILCLDIPINSLLVDTVLPAFSFGVLMFINNSTNNRKKLLLCIPLLSSIMLIKNSGIFFVIINISILIYKMKKQKNWKNIYYYITIISPFLIYYLWNRHCKYSFSNSINSKHAVSLLNYSKVLNGKTNSDIISILKKMLEASISGIKLYSIIGYTIMIGIMIFIANKYIKNTKENIIKYKHTIVSSILIYLIYMIGTFIMYIFSMPLGEAIRLACFNRYRNTIFIFIYCLISRYIIILINSEYKKKTINYIVTILSIILITLTNYFSFNNFKSIVNLNINNNSERRVKINEIIKEYNLDLNKKYIVVLDQDDRGYMYYLLQYTFENNKNKAIIVKNSINENTIKQYDYLIDFTENNEILKQFINQNYPSQKNKKIIDTNGVNK